MELVCFMVENHYITQNYAYSNTNSAGLKLLNVIWYNNLFLFDFVVTYPCA